MGLFPCSIGTHRYAGPQQTIYPAIAQGQEVFRTRLRLCPTHFDVMLEKLVSRANDAAIDHEDALAPTCIECRGDVIGSRWQFFATAYASKQERRDFWAVIHDECVRGAKHDWLSMP